MPLLDLERMQMLGLGDDPEIHQVIEHFADALPGKVSQLRQWNDSGQSAAVAGLLHELQGSAANCGFRAVADKIHELRQHPELLKSSASGCPDLENIVKASREEWARLA